MYATSITNSEKAIALEDCYAGQTGKFFMPILTPKLNSDDIIDNLIHQSTPSNIVSGNSTTIGVQDYHEINYLELKTPTKAFKGSKMIVNLLCGMESLHDVSNFNIVGVYDDTNGTDSNSNNRTESTIITTGGSIT